jgi:hypothetical protein
MEAVCSSKTSVNLYQIMSHHIPEYTTLHSQRCWNPACLIICASVVMFVQSCLICCGNDCASKFSVELAVMSKHAASLMLSSQNRTVERKPCCLIKEYGNIHFHHHHGSVMCLTMCAALQKRTWIQLYCLLSFFIYVVWMKYCDCRNHNFNFNAVFFFALPRCQSVSFGVLSINLNVWAVYRIFFMSDICEYGVSYSYIRNKWWWFLSWSNGQLAFNS